MLYYHYLVTCEPQSVGLLEETLTLYVSED